MFTRISARHLAVAVFLTATTLSCTTFNYQRQQDEEVFERVRAAYQQARNNPGNGRAAMAYADAVIRGWRSGVFVRCLQRRRASEPPTDGEGEASSETSCALDPEKHLEEAGRLLDRAAEVQKGDGPALVAKKGLMYCSAARTDRCLTELKRSMSMGPNVLAGTGLATWHGNHDNYRKVRDVCERTLPHLERESTRYQFMKLCIDQSGAASARGGLDWASKTNREFFLKERRRRRQASRRRKRRKRRRNARRRRRVKKCVARCKERGHLCMRDCRTKQCETSCNNAYQACLDKCEVDAQR